MKVLATRALGCSLVIVSGLTVLSRLTDSTVLFFLLYPGVTLSLLITGGHGGAAFEDRAAMVVSFLVNLLAYFVICGFSFELFRRSRTAS